MKNMIIIFSIIPLIFNFSDLLHSQVPQSEQIVNNFMSQSAGKLAKKYSIKPSGMTVGMPSCIVKLLGLEFDIIGPLSIDEIRTLLITLSDDFLYEINEDPNIRPYLESYPFTKDKINIVLFFKDKNLVRLVHPHVRIASIKKRRLEYLTFNSISVPGLESEYVESEEEALNILKNTIN